MTLSCINNKQYAKRGNRTHTPVKGPDFESGASTNSAILAIKTILLPTGVNNYSLRPIVKDKHIITTTRRNLKRYPFFLPSSLFEFRPICAAAWPASFCKAPFRAPIAEPIISIFSPKLESLFENSLILDPIVLEAFFK